MRNCLTSSIQDDCVLSTLLFGFFFLSLTAGNIYDSYLQQKQKVEVNVCKSWNVFFNTKVLVTYSCRKYLWFLLTTEAKSWSECVCVKVEMYLVLVTYYHLVLLCIVTKCITDRFTKQMIDNTYQGIFLTYTLLEYHTYILLEYHTYIYITCVTYTHITRVSYVHITWVSYRHTYCLSITHFGIARKPSTSQSI